jgi:hypothetical protein
MSFDSLSELRSTCKAVIQQCEQSEISLQQAQKTASDNRQAELISAQHKKSQVYDQTKQIVDEIRKLVMQADALLLDLKLSPRINASVVSASGVKLDDLLKSLANHRSQARMTYSQLQNLAEVLKKKQQRRWWEFWKLWN